jgi:hypothetical protein
MFLTYSDALRKYGSRYQLRKAVSENKLKHVSHGYYSTTGDHDSLSLIARKYPDAIVTGLTAFYIHGLTDVIPDVIDVASKRRGTKISDSRIKQHFVPEDWLDTGKSTIVHDGVELTIYDQERMLLELIRSRNKLPYDIYKEIVASYRRRADDLDLYKLQDYAEVMPRGARHLDIVMKEVF